MDWISAKEQLPNLGQRVVLKNYGDLIIFATLCPFTNENEKLGWLFINPISKNLTWSEIINCDFYIVHKE